MQADGDLGEFLDYCTYGHMIDNVVLIVTGTLHERDVQVSPSSGSKAARHVLSRSPVSLPTGQQPLQRQESCDWVIPKQHAA